MDMFDSPFHNDNGNGINYWKGRNIVPLEELHKIANNNEAFFIRNRTPANKGSASILS